MDILAARLRAARKAKGLTQRELAKRVGMDQGHISHLENDGKGVSTEKLQALARVLDVSVSHLLGEDLQEAPTEGGMQEQLCGNRNAPRGLRDLAQDDALTKTLNITEQEWQALASIALPNDVTKDGYVQLLVTLRAITPAHWRAA